MQLLFFPSWQSALNHPQGRLHETHREAQGIESVVSALQLLRHLPTLQHRIAEIRIAHLALGSYPAGAATR